MRTTFSARGLTLGTVATLAATSLLSFTSVGTAQAADFTVSNTANAGLGSLRWAITQANASPGSDTVTFGASVTGEIPLGEPITITDDLIIEGPGADVLAVDGGGASQLFVATDRLNVSGLTFANGRSAANGGAIDTSEPLTLSEVVFRGNTANGAGGAIATTESLNIDSSSFEENNAQFGGAIRSIGNGTIQDSNFVDNSANEGGALNYDTPDGLTIERTSFSSNSAATRGGAASLDGPVTVVSSTFENNAASADGGAIFYEDGTGMWDLGVLDSVLEANTTTGGAGGAVAATGDVVVVQSAIRDNAAAAQNGGGVFGTARVTVTRSEISGNEALNEGGGIYATDELSLNNSTVSDNTANIGGGVSVIGSVSNLNHSTIVDNVGRDSGGGLNSGGMTAPSLYATVIANNTSPGSPDVLGNATANDSFIGEVDNANIEGMNNLFGDPQLGALGDNGGSTHTHLPAATSPLIDAIGPSFTATVLDQRTFERVVNDLLDIGAVEVNAADQRIWDPITPTRLLDTRPTGMTTDGDFEALGRRGAGSMLRLQVGGRGGIPEGARGAILYITAVQPDRTGFITAFACDVAMPTASSLNYVEGANLGNEVVVSLDDNGEVCLFTSGETHLTVDASGVVGPASALVGLTPARVLDTRDNGTTVDQLMQAGGRRDADSQLRLPIGGRGGVPDDASAVIVNVTAVAPNARGFVTVDACGQDLPLSSSLNVEAGVNRANEIVAGLDDGDLCLYASTEMHLVVDVVAALDERSDYTAVEPARLLDTRGVGTTVDGEDQAEGRPAAGTTTRLTIGGRANLPDTVRTVNMNITAVQPDGVGFVTVWACDDDQPNAASLNFIPGANGGNEITVGVDNSEPIGAPISQICIFNSAATDLTVDVAGYTDLPPSPVIN